MKTRATTRLPGSGKRFASKQTVQTKIAKPTYKKAPKSTAERVRDCRRRKKEKEKQQKQLDLRERKCYYQLLQTRNRQVCVTETLVSILVAKLAGLKFLSWKKVLLTNIKVDTCHHITSPDNCIHPISTKQAVTLKPSDEVNNCTYIVKTKCTQDEAEF